MDLYHFISASELFFLSPLSPLRQCLSTAACLWLHRLPEPAEGRAGRSLSLCTEQGWCYTKGRTPEQCTRPHFPLNVCLRMPLGPRFENYCRKVMYLSRWCLLQQPSSLSWEVNKIPFLLHTQPWLQAKNSWENEQLAPWGLPGGCALEHGWDTPKAW